MIPGARDTPPPRSHRHLLVRGGTVVTMDGARRVLDGDVLITDGRIVAVGPGIDTPPATRLLDAAGLVVLPGFVQAHIHFGQALFRGLAEGRPLLRWLRERVWPLEAAHDEDTAYGSGMLGAVDCLLAGTTTVQEFGLVHGTDGIARAVRDSGMRGIVAKCLMDAGEGVPSALIEPVKPAMEAVTAHHARWEGAAGGRVRTAISPRFILSCSPGLWEAATAKAAELGISIHTHLLESPDEAEAVRAELGTGQMEFLDSLGVLDSDLRIAHAVRYDERADAIRAGRELKVAHCPSANLKLGSGIADLVTLRSLPGISVGIGCDGAPCNNDHDVLEEMRLAALLQSYRNGPGSCSALDILELATCEGALSLGMAAEIGSIEPGKAGDLVVLDLNRPSSFGDETVSVYDRIVYTAARDAIRWVVVDGEILVDRGTFPHLDIEAIGRKAREAIGTLRRRASL